MLNYTIIPRKNPQSRETKFYAQLTPTTPVVLSVLADVISKQSTVTVHDVKAVISALEEHLVNYLLQGNSIRLGDLGSFRLTIRSGGAESEEAFDSNLIKGVSVRFTASRNMRYLLSKSNPALKFRKERESEAEAGENGENSNE